jgi:hypothetical protein
VLRIFLKKKLGNDVLASMILGEQQTSVCSFLKMKIYPTSACNAHSQVFRRFSAQKLIKKA